VVASNFLFDIEIDNLRGFKENKKRTYTWA
jgi:hypothetical protein